MLDAALMPRIAFAFAPRHSPRPGLGSGSFAPSRFSSYLPLFSLTIRQGPGLFVVYPGVCLIYLLRAHLGDVMVRRGVGAGFDGVCVLVSWM